MKTYYTEHHCRAYRPENLLREFWAESLADLHESGVYIHRMVAFMSVGYGWTKSIAWC